jgi:hypothetical protein
MPWRRLGRGGKHHHSWLRHCMEVSGENHVPAASLPGKSSGHLLDRGFRKPWKLSRSCEKEKNFLPVSGIETRASGPLPVGIPTELPRPLKIKLSSKIYCKMLNPNMGASPIQKHNRPLWVAVQGLIRPTPYTYITYSGTASKRDTIKVTGFKIWTFQAA